MPRVSTRTDRPKEERECKTHGQTTHVWTITKRKPDGTASCQWRCMVCRREYNRTRQYLQRRELKADTRPGAVKPLAPVVKGAERPAAQTFEVAS